MRAPTIIETMKGNCWRFHQPSLSRKSSLKRRIAQEYKSVVDDVRLVPIYRVFANGSSLMIAQEHELFGSGIRICFGDSANATPVKTVQEDEAFFAEVWLVTVDGSAEVWLDAIYRALE